MVMGCCDVCENDAGETRTYNYSEDGLVIISTEICECCADEILPVFFDAVGYGCERESLEWPDTADRSQSSGLEPESMTD